MNRKARIREIDTLCQSLQRQLDILHDELKELRLEQSIEDHPCPCVKLNSDIEVYDMIEQERHGRRGLGFGLVAETLSAIKLCEVCKGTGIPGGRKDDE